jgi:outer membrane protein OmpA-like peptidoglycan-associated protein
VKGVPENQGCPQKEKQLVIITREKLVIKDKVYFDTGKSKIQPRSFPLLNQIARILIEHPDVKRVVVEGHTDSRGSAAANRTLSQARAEAVKTYLVQHGVEAARLDAKGYGPDRPVADNGTAAGREQNRRVEFVIATEEKVETHPVEAP